MADAAVVASLFIAGAGAIASNVQGNRQVRQQKKARQMQERAQAQARSAAAAERRGQAMEAAAQRRRKPDASAILARARGQRQAGETFLSGSTGTGMLGTTRFLG